MIGHFVQRFDKNTNRYLKIDREGCVVGEQPHPYAGLEEIEPVEPESPVRARMSDPLDGFR